MAASSGAPSASRPPDSDTTAPTTSGDPELAPSAAPELLPPLDPQAASASERPDASMIVMRFPGLFIEFPSLIVLSSPGLIAGEMRRAWFGYVSEIYRLAGNSKSSGRGVP
jgi:hypothetical protein